MASTLFGRQRDDVKREIVDQLKATLAHLYTFIPPNEPTRYSTAELAEVLGLGHAKTEDRAQQLRELGLLKRHINWYTKESGRQGRWSSWELPHDMATATEILDDWCQRFLADEVRTYSAIMADTKRDKRKERKAAKKAAPSTVTVTATSPISAQPGTIEPVLSMSDLAASPTVKASPNGWAVEDKRVTLADIEEAFPATMGITPPEEVVALAHDDEEEVRAVAGEDAPSPFEELRPMRKASDAEALVEAARQYNTRFATIDSKIKALVQSAKDLGIEVDPTMLSMSIKATPDAQLETISLVLPVIDRLAATNERLSVENVELRRKAKQVDQLESDVRGLRRTNERLIAERSSSVSH